jgi:hypothetical protein
MTKVAQNKIVTHIDFLDKQMWLMLIFHWKVSVG